jgi:hypothetical protein
MLICNKNWEFSYKKFSFRVSKKYTITTKLSKHLPKLNVIKKVKQHYFFLQIDSNKNQQLL